MAYNFQIAAQYSTSNYKITFENDITLIVKTNAGTQVFSRVLTTPTALRVVGANYQIGYFTTNDPTFVRNINLTNTPHSLVVSKDVNNNPCFIGVGKDGADTWNFKYLLTKCPVQLHLANNNISLTSPYCGTPDGCNGCFREWKNLELGDSQ